MRRCLEWRLVSDAHVNRPNSIDKSTNICTSLFVACFSALRSLIAVDLMGLEKLTNAFGILMMFQGLAAVVGSPIAGK